MLRLLRSTRSPLVRSLHATSRASLPRLPTKEEVFTKFQFPKYTNTINSINKDIHSHWDQTVTLQGWIDKKPKKLGKKIAFATLRDFEGNFTQIISKDPEIVSKIQKSQIEDCISITGKITKRFAKADQSSEEGEEVRWDLDIQEFNTLNSSDVLTSQLEALKTLPNEFPQQYRYLQLRLPYFQNALKTRSDASNLIRNYLINELKFMEIETPLLFKSTPEGAREFLVPTRKSNLFYALPQSPQQYKQLLMASGVKNYFQIARCFRDEDLRSDRQPEFTQVDLEMSFANARDVQDVIESTVQKIFRDIGKNELLTLNEDGSVRKGGDLIHLNYDEVIAKYGIDKPDLRSTLEIVNLTGFCEIPENPEFPVFEALVLRGVLDESNQHIPQNIANMTQYSKRKPYFLEISTPDLQKSWTEQISSKFQLKNTAQLHEKLNLQIGDVLVYSDRAETSYENPTPLGRCRQLAIEEYPDRWRRCSEHENVALWVENFPLFNPVEIEGNSGYPIYDYKKFEATHHPFTMVQLEDYDQLFQNPLSVKGDHYDLVINGMEIGGGSRRIHDAEIQKYVLSEVLQIKNHDELFGHLLKALELGCPPHAGFAIGFDRLMTILINSNTIRDVIAFPKTSNGSDLVVSSPSAVSDKNLKEYFIKNID
ncbi:hypothetical protein WICPIJ_003174 [Wickerhamomyces pijperi]|uniref:Aminoacyl-transfer RNA synthetases class-II family profile domain-containing protein n=1 Tax=Wickerhamomyces pijperi TaxID=599730 RepID=A0A9P8QAD3_WICPI|nr:hypothetical protein WICPIJ_003174 [Wickerhamomyces pijperi]